MFFICSWVQRFTQGASSRLTQGHLSRLIKEIHHVEIVCRRSRSSGLDRNVRGHDRNLGSGDPAALNHLFEHHSQNAAFRSPLGDKQESSGASVIKRGQGALQTSPSAGRVGSTSSRPSLNLAVADHVDFCSVVPERDALKLIAPSPL
jgi:hypothetical protein